MRYAILSDIHSNLEAFSVALDILQQEAVGQYLSAGDLVGYGADPKECLKRWRALPGQAIAGNHEWGCLGKLSADWFNRYAREALEWTRSQLNFEELNWVRMLRLTHEDGAVSVAHGTFHKPDRFLYLTDVGTAIETLLALRTPICFIGHTHVPFLLEYDLQERKPSRLLRTEQELAGVQLSADRRYRYLVNVGSVGQPRDGDTRACFAIYDSDKRTLQIRRAAYPLGETQAKIRTAGLPAFLADRLAMGH